jgi:Lysozyme like domain/CHAP domain
VPLAGRHLTYLETARYAHKAGIPLGENLVIATAIVEFESRRYCGAWNFNTKTGDRSYGLWQINLLGALKAERMKLYGLKTPEDLYDPATNARIMVSISKGGTNWRPWGAYTNGHYKKAMVEAHQAVTELRAELSGTKPIVKEVAAVSGVEAMVHRAEKDLGLGEPNYIQAWYRARNGSAYGGNFPWCDASITKWAYDSGNHSVTNFGTDYAYTVGHANRFAANSQWHVGASGIRRGDIVFFDWQGTNNRGAIDHVGLVTSVAGGTVYTIEGNIGNVVARKVRYEGTIAGYGRPKYANSVPAPADPTLAAVSLKVVAFALTHPMTQEPASGSADVGRMQDALVKVGSLAAGSFLKGKGDQFTVNAYAAYQRKLGYSGADADGVPGMTSLSKLGAATKLFRVVA